MFNVLHLTLIWKLANVKKQDLWYGPRFGRAESLTDPWRVTDSCCGRNRMCCCWWTCVSWRNRTSCQPHMVLAPTSHPELHHITGNIILRSTVSAAHDFVFRYRCSSKVSSPAQHTPDTRASAAAPPENCRPTSWQAVCSTCTNTIIHQDEKWWNVKPPNKDQLTKLQLLRLTTTSYHTLSRGTVRDTDSLLLRNMMPFWKKVFLGALLKTANVKCCINFSNSHFQGTLSINLVQNWTCK